VVELAHLAEQLPHVLLVGDVGRDLPHAGDGLALCHRRRPAATTSAPIAAAARAVARPMPAGSFTTTTRWPLSR
jgi:hypothetical protein